MKLRPLNLFFGFLYTFSFVAELLRGTQSYAWALFFATIASLGFSTSFTTHD